MSIAGIKNVILRRSVLIVTVIPIAIIGSLIGALLGLWNMWEELWSSTKDAWRGHPR